MCQYTKSDGKKCKRKESPYCWQHSASNDSKTSNSQKEGLFIELKNQGISQKTLSAMRLIPREKFIPLEYRNMAYINKPISIGKGQTISQPYIVGYMIDE